ncbi:MAG: hypothetical protein R3228_05690 [Halioglobus sp.]|nr:hypothetical protein [Halioglobus sp.]
MFPRRGLAWGLACLLALGACSFTDTPPDAVRQPPDPARGELVAGRDFLHRVVHRRGSGRSLHVYIEGDGRPWVTPISAARDPTPRRPVLPALLALDEAPVLYLGRPCYYATADTACDDRRWWTSHRYAPAVLDSLDAALDRFAGSYDSVTLIGHSGGGTLAYLLAARRGDVAALVTLAANLNVGMWAAYHGYSRLEGSLDPAAMPAPGAAVQQLHYLGGQDERVSSAMITSVLGGQAGARLTVLEEVGHSCCWAPHWPGILQRLP